MICFVSSLLLMTPTRGDDKSKDEETLRNASTATARFGSFALIAAMASSQFANALSGTAQVVTTG
jgi:hypothetical protein